MSEVSLMKKNTPMENLRLTLGSISVVIFLLCLAIAITIWSIPMFLFSVNLFNLDQVVNISKENILENYIILLQYLHFPWIDQLSMPDFPTSASGALHFSDVKNLFYLLYALLLASGIFSFFFLNNLRKNEKLYKLKNIFRVLVFVPLIIIVLLYFFFDEIFLLFHLTFFDNDAWMYDPRTDPIILVLPQEFFLMCFIEVFVLLELGLVAMYGLGKYNYNKLLVK